MRVYRRCCRGRGVCFSLSCHREHHAASEAAAGLSSDGVALARQHYPRAIAPHQGGAHQLRRAPGQSFAPLGRIGRLPEPSSTTESACGLGKFGKMKIGRFNSDCCRFVPEDEGHLRATLEWLDAPVDPMSSSLLKAAMELRIGLHDGLLAMCNDEISPLVRRATRWSGDTSGYCSH